MTTDLPDIPQEVVHHIVSLLYSDKHTLKNCSLVSKRWLHPSRVYLFESVRIRDSTGLTEFLAFLATTGHINYVRRLFVSGIEAVDTNRIPPRESLVYAISLREASYGDCDDTTDLTPKQLSYLLTHLPVLRHLELEKFVLRKYYGPPDPVVDIRTSPKQHSLQTLEFRSCVFGSAESLFGILSLFRELEELSFNNQSHFTTLLAGSKEPIPDLWAPQLSLNPLKVTSLSFAFSPMLDSLDAVTNATVQFLDQDAIRSLVILNWGCTNYPVVRDLLRGMSPSLCSLTLDLTCLFRMVVPEPFNVRYEFNISSFHQLGFLQLEVSMDTYPHDSHIAVWTHVISILSHINSTIFRHLKIVWTILSYTLEEDGIIRTLGRWDEMDLLLQVLPMLQTVEFYWDDPRCRWSIGSWGVTRDGGEGEDETQVMTLQVGCSPDSKIEEACAVVRSALPGLDARNLLSFSSSYDIQ